MLAAEFRAEFGRDVAVDIVGYRRHGHNELDDPTPTQPITYDIISQSQGVYETYKNKVFPLDYVICLLLVFNWIYFL